MATKWSIKRKYLLEEMSQQQFREKFENLTFSNQIILRTKLAQWLKVIKKARARQQKEEAEKK